MRKLFILLFVLLILSGCSTKVFGIDKATEFDLIMKDTAVAYDLRSFEDCELGHIKGFACIDYGSNMAPKDQAIYNITNKYSQYKKNDIILLISYNTEDSLYVAQHLSKKGFRKVYYFIGGYEEYVKQKGDSFIPEVGCGC